MTTREQLLRETTALPESLLVEVLDFTLFLKQKQTTEHYNEETVEALLEAERIAHDPSVKGYRDVDLMFEDLLR